jgi:AraC-like DNA-binding protein
MQPAASFVTIRRHIDQHLRQPSLNADVLAKWFGLSRASLYRLFEPVGGVAFYIRKALLARASQEIAASDDSSHRIGPVAYRIGFKNVSAFNHLFNEHYGVKPGEAREFSRTMSSALAPGEADEKATLAYWLRRIGAATGAPQKF